jgi:hypothetical protein
LWVVIVLAHPTLGRYLVLVEFGDWLCSVHCRYYCIVLDFLVDPC